MQLNTDLPVFPGVSPGHFFFATRVMPQLQEKEHGERRVPGARGSYIGISLQHNPFRGVSVPAILQGYAERCKGVATELGEFLFELV